MKRWIKFCAVSGVLSAGFLLMVLGGYLIGWKSGADAANPSRKWSGEPAKQNDPASARKQTANSTMKAGFEAGKPEKGRLEDTLSRAWHSLRFAPHPDVAAARLWELISSLDEPELASAFSLARDLPGGDTRREAIWMVLRHWAEKDAEGAIAACAREFEGWDRLDWMVSLLGVVSRQDPLLGYRAYREHLAALDSPSHDSAVFPLTRIFREWAERDFNGAWAEFERLNPREQQYALRGMSSLTHGESESGRALLRRLNEEGDTELIQMARLEVARGFGGDASIEGAEPWLDSQNLSAEARRKLENTIAQAWALKNPRGAAEWLNEQAGPGEAGARLGRVIGLWADWEPVESGEWLNARIKEGQNMDAAVDVFARQIASTDAAAALAWAAHIASPEQRLRTSKSLGESFRRQLISNGEALIRGSALSDADKAAALQGLARE